MQITNHPINDTEKFSNIKGLINLKIIIQIMGFNMSVLKIIIVWMILESSNITSARKLPSNDTNIIRFILSEYLIYLYVISNVLKLLFFQLIYKKDTSFKIFWQNLTIFSHIALYFLKCIGNLRFFFLS